MPSPSVQVLGAYRVELTPELLAEAMDIKYGGLDLEPEERHHAEAAVRNEISNAVLLEVLVSNRNSEFDVDAFGQQGSDQAAYDEHFLSEDGTSVEGLRLPPGKSLRIAFFFHFFDPAKPLLTSYGPVAVPGIQEMPERFRELVPYDPVD